MPQYELMYILSSAVADDQEPELTNSLTAFIQELGGEILSVEKLGRKRLAYPIKKTRSGFYVLINFRLAPDKTTELDHKIRVTAGIIRHLILNLEETLVRMAKDKIEQRQIRKPAEIPIKKVTKEAKPEVVINLDEQIEKALQEDITK